MKRAIEALVLVGLVFLVAFGALAGWRLLGLLDEAQETVVASGADSRTLLAAGARAVDQADVRLKDPSLDAAVANLARSSANLERMSRAGAESAEAIRDMLKPTRKAFWRRLLELMIPKPTVRFGL